MNDKTYIPGDLKDIQGRVMENTWVAVIYALVCVAMVHILSITPDTFSLFVVVQLPTLVAVTIALYEPDWRHYRLTFYWVITGVAVPVLFSTQYPDNIRATIIFFIIAILVGYWLYRGIRGSIRGTLGSYTSHNIEIPHVVAKLLSVWGATLQVSILGLALLSFPWQEYTGISFGRNILQTTLRYVTLSSPTAWIPTYILFVGIIMFSVRRFRDNPYDPVDYEKVVNVSTPYYLEPFLTAIRIPTWIGVVIVGFLVHFVRHIIRSFYVFINNWLGRILQMLYSFVIPLVLMIIGSIITWYMMSELANYIQTTKIFSTHYIFLFVGTHIASVVALSMYATASGPIFMDIRPRPFWLSWTRIEQFSKEDGMSIFTRVGKVFSLFGVVFFAIPFGTILPGGAMPGLFSIAYCGIIIGLFIYQYVSHGKYSGFDDSDSDTSDNSDSVGTMKSELDDLSLLIKRCRLLSDSYSDADRQRIVNRLMELLEDVQDNVVLTDMPIYYTKYPLVFIRAWDGRNPHVSISVFEEATEMLERDWEFIFSPDESGDSYDSILDSIPRNSTYITEDIMIEKIDTIEDTGSVNEGEVISLIPGILVDGDQNDLLVPEVRYEAGTRNAVD